MLVRLLALALVTVGPVAEAQRRGGKPPPPKQSEIDDARARHEKDFIAFDLNSDNYVDASEIRQVTPAISQEELSGLFIAADKDEDGLLTLDEYAAASDSLAEPVEDE